MSGEEKVIDRPEDTWLTAKDVARRYGMAIEWVYHCKDLRPYGRKMGKYLRFSLSNLRRFEESRENVSRGWTTDYLMRPNYRAVLQGKKPFTLLFDMK